jgi:predicted Zn-dependent protease
VTSRQLEKTKANRVGAKPGALGRYLRVSALVLVLGIVLSVAFDGCARNPVTGEKEFSVISEKDEIALGTGAYGGAIAEVGGQYNDAVLSAYITDIGTRLSQVSHRPQLPYEFTVVGTSMMNAFALPGGKICITTGLLSKCDNEAQVAGVLGHEIGHVTARHAAKAISRAYLFQIPLVVGAIYANEKGKGEELVALGAIGAGLLQLKYSRDQESQADGLGMVYSAKAGYNPDGVVQMLEVLQAAHESEPSAVEGWFLTHPLTSSRIEDAKQMLSKDYPDWTGRTDALFADRFKENTTRLMAKVGAYEHYDKAEEHLGKGEVDQALAEYHAALDIDDAQPQFHCGLGEALVKKGDVPAAVESFTKAKELTPELFRGRYDLGYSLFKTERYQPAADELNAAVEIVPTVPPAQYYLGRCQEEMGQKAEAIQSYENVVALDPESDIGKDAQKRASALK